MPAHSWGSLFIRDLLRYLQYILFCIYGGAVLIGLPWTEPWSSNYFFAMSPLLRSLGLHPVVRGLVSGVGVALLLHGVVELKLEARRLPDDRGRREPES